MLVSERRASEASSRSPSIGVGMIGLDMLDIVKLERWRAVIRGSIPMPGTICGVAPLEPRASSSGSDGPGRHMFS